MVAALAVFLLGGILPPGNGASAASAVDAYSAQSIREGYGLADSVSDAEIGAMLAREEELSEVANQIRQWASQNVPDRFAGVSLEHHGTDVSLVVRVTEPTGEVAETLRELAGDAPVRVTAAEHPLELLEETHAAVTAALPQLYREHGVQTATLDVTGNRVAVKVVDGTDLDAVRRALGERFPPDRLRVEAGEPVRFTSHTHDVPHPLRGGIRIWLYAASSSACTLGFMGEQGAFGDKLRFFTAGHCVERVGAIWMHDTRGAGVVRYYRNGGTTDVAIADAVFDATDRSALVFRTSTSSYRVKGQQSPAFDEVGQTYCSIGHASDRERCGRLLHKNVSMTDGARTWNRFRQVDFSSRRGDSGAPVYRNLSSGSLDIQAAGLVSALGGGDTFYGHIGHVVEQASLNTSVLCYVNSTTTKPCGWNTP